jgi:hypothetical protein
MKQPALTTSPADTRLTERPPILEATRSLGINDRRIAKLNGVSPEAVHAWSTGKRPIPHVRHVALLFVVTRLAGIVGAAFPPQSKYARRAAVARESAAAWAQLAKEELEEALGGEIPMDLIAHGYEVGEAMLAKLEAS